LLFPLSVTVIGSGRRGLGRLVLEHLHQGGFGGEVCCVSPPAGEAGAASFDEAFDPPSPPDLVVVAVPAAQVPVVLRACARRGCGAAIVVSAGPFNGDEVRAAAGEMLLLGPNCMGLIHTHREARLHASFGVHPVERGPVALITHSGSVADYALYHHRSWGVGFSLVASVGNEQGVTIGQLLAEAAVDDSTKVIALYLEQPAQPGELLQAIAATAKPVVVLLAGSTPLGARAAESHTGRLTAAAGSAPVAALLRRAGALLVQGLDELMASCVALSGCPGGAGRRVAVITNAGGPAVLAVDALHHARMNVVDAGPAVGAQGNLPELAALAGPAIDLSASARPEHFGQAAALLQDQADLLMGLVMSPEGRDPGPVARALRQAWDGPLAVAVMAGGGQAEGARQWLGQQGVVACREPALAVRAATTLACRGERSLPADPAAACQHRGEGPAFPGAELAEEILEKNHRARRLRVPLGQALDLCQSCGVPVVPYGRTTASEGVEGALGLAEQLGYPVVLKVDGATINHRTEQGLVSVALRDEQAVAAAVAHFLPMMAEREQDDSDLGLVVQAYTRGAELLVGCTRVAGWGPVALVGWGGVEAEAWAEVAYLGLPLEEAALHQALEQLRGSRRLGPWRGAPAVKLNSLVDAAMRLSELLCHCPMIETIELSPFIAARSSTGPEGAVDVRLVLRPEGEKAG
jgi:acetyltransferase